MLHFINSFYSLFSIDYLTPNFLPTYFIQPHLPWVVPQKYYDRFPPDEVKLPPYPTTNNWKEWEEQVMKDLKDVPEYAIKKIARPDKEFTEVIELGKWETSIQSYLAAIVSYIDVSTIGVLGQFCLVMHPRCISYTHRLSSTSLHSKHRPTWT